MTITAAALISTLASQASGSTNRQSVAAPAAPQRPNVADTATISRASQAALATATGATSPTQPDDTYNFSDMTSKQAISAAGQLATKGIITGDQFATVQVLGVHRRRGCRFAGRALFARSNLWTRGEGRRAILGRSRRGPVL
jgi:hypothetical protein